MSTKKFLIILVIVLLVVVPAVVWFSIKGGQPVQPSSLTVVGTDQATGSNSIQRSARGAETIRTLSSLKEAKLDTDFFEESAFKRLVDFSVSLPEISIGRDSPFSPLQTISTSSIFITPSI